MTKTLKNTFSILDSVEISQDLSGNGLDESYTEDLDQPLPVIRKEKILYKKNNRLKCDVCEKVLLNKREFNKHVAAHKNRFTRIFAILQLNLIF